MEMRSAFAGLVCAVIFARTAAGMAVTPRPCWRTGGAELGRRQLGGAVLRGGSALLAAGLLAPPLARAEDELATKVEPSLTMRSIQEGTASYTVPSPWIRPVAPAGGGKPGPWVDKVGSSVADEIEVSVVPTNLGSLDELGEIARVPLNKLGFEDLARADLVAAKRRQGSTDGTSTSPYFDYDLAVSPTTCERDQEIVPGSCMPTRVVLLSCTVRDGKLHVLRINASPSQWRKAGTTLRDVRRSFTVT